MIPSDGEFDLGMYDAAMEVIPKRKREILLT